MAKDKVVVRDRFQVSISESENFGLKCDDPSLTKQSDLKDSDINNILGKFVKTGILPSLKPEGVYADVSELGDYRECLEKVMKAEELFSQLPSKVRDRFSNDPESLISFCLDEKNMDELVSLGLAKPRVPEVSNPSLPDGVGSPVKGESTAASTAAPSRL